MNTVLTALFDGRDEADLALMRLRRSGLRFEVLGLSFPETGEGAAQLGVFSPFNSSMLIQPGTNDPYTVPIGSRALFGRTEARKTRDTVLQLRIDSADLKRARDVLRSAGGRSLRVNP